MATCEVTPNSNIIDYVCGLKSKGGILRNASNTKLPLPPPPPLHPSSSTDEDSSSFVDVLPPPPSSSDYSDFMSSSSIISSSSGDYTDYEHDDQPDMIDGVTIHHYPQPQTLTVPGTHAYAHRQLVPSNQKVNTVLPPLIPLIQSYQGKAIRDMERLIQQLEFENSHMATAATSA